jgi:putative DNA methylase
MVDDPSSWPDLFPTEKAQVKERQRLFKIIEDLVKWESTTNEEILQKARDEIWRSWRRACAENVDHPRAKELFDRDKLPGFHDPFAGGGALPFEAQRLGLESYASDLNPVAVLINKAMIEIPPKFAGRPPVNPDAQTTRDLNTWEEAKGVAEDVRYYGQWVRDEAEKRIGHLYPAVEITRDMTSERPDLMPLVGKRLTVVAWIWARTVKSPNPAFRNVDVPLVSTFMLSTKSGKEVFVKPLIETGCYRFTVNVGKPVDLEAAKNGTKLERANFACLMSGAPISGDYIKSEAVAGRMGARLMAIVAEGERGRVYLSPTLEQEETSRKAEPIWRPEGEIAARMTGGNCTPYGLTSWGDLFTCRQLVSLTTFSDLLQNARERVAADAILLGLDDDKANLRDGGEGPKAYAEAVCLYLAFALDKVADRGSTLGRWDPTPTQSGIINTFSRQALPMTWDYAESNPLGDASGNYKSAVNLVAKALLAGRTRSFGHARQDDASAQSVSSGKVVSTDPPYYDNIGYADLSDFFYVWLRRSQRPVFPELFATMAVPKAEELVANSHRQGGKAQAEQFFLEGMTQAMRRLADQAHPAFPVTIYYAFKQSETTGDGGEASTGWETFLAAVIQAGFALTGTWPMRTELSNRMIGSGTNALASSIVLVCRKREASASTATRREFLSALQKELPNAIADLQRGYVAPVDLQQAAIGPGMAIFTRYAQVVDAEGKPLSVRDALTMINQALDEALAHQEGDFDGDTRWALTWFEQFGFAEGDYGVAEVLSKAKATSVQGIVDAGIAISGKGKVRLLRPEDLPGEWNPTADSRLTVWEIVHHLIRALDNGETSAAELFAKVGSKSEVARELAYRLYSISDRTKRSQDAQRYNGLVQSWPEIVAIASKLPKIAGEAQFTLEGMS